MDLLESLSLPLKSQQMDFAKFRTLSEILLSHKITEPSAQIPTGTQVQTDIIEYAKSQNHWAFRSNPNSQTEADYGQNLESWASFIYQLTLFSFPGSAWECMPGDSAAYTNV